MPRRHLSPRPRAPLLTTRPSAVRSWPAGLLAPCVNARTAAQLNSLTTSRVNYSPATGLAAHRPLLLAHSYTNTRVVRRANAVSNS